MTYAAGNVPVADKDLRRFLASELQKIQEALSFTTTHSLEFRAVAPTKPREGMLYGADGANWNPGSGQGVYCYYNGAWHYLG